VHAYNESAFSFQTAYGSGKPKAVWVLRAQENRYTGEEKLVYLFTFLLVYS